MYDHMDKLEIGAHPWRPSSCVLFGDTWCGTGFAFPVSSNIGGLENLLINWKFFWEKSSIHGDSFKCHIWLPLGIRFDHAWSRSILTTCKKHLETSPSQNRKYYSNVIFVSKCFAQILFGIFATPFKERSLNLATCAEWGVWNDLPPSPRYYDLIYLYAHPPRIPRMLSKQLFYQLLVSA